MIPDEVRFYELHAKKCLQPDEEKELEEVAVRLGWTVFYHRCKTPTADKREGELRRDD